MLNVTSPTQIMESCKNRVNNRVPGFLKIVGKVITFILIHKNVRNSNTDKKLLVMRNYISLMFR